MVKKLFPLTALIVVSASISGCAAETTDQMPIDNVAQASSVQLKGGKNAEPQFTDLGMTLQAAGALSGLGNGDVHILLAAKANPTATCTTPSGSNEAPGQNPAEVDVTGSTAIPADKIKNGNTPFLVVTDPPTTPVEGAPDCSNHQWTEDIVDMAFTSATIKVEQPTGNLVLTISCTFSPATEDGVVSGITCTSG